MINKKTYYGDNFKEWILPLMVEEEKCELKEIKLEKDMWDTEIQAQISNTPINPNQFLYFIENILEDKDKDKDKVYIFHIQLADRVVAVNVYWYGDRWYLFANPLDNYRYRWYGGHSFFSPATETKNLKTSDPLTLGNFETRLKVVEDKLQAISKILQ